MADISMCDGSFESAAAIDGYCELRTKCYRYLAKADPRWQSYIDAKTCRYHDYDLFWNWEKDK